MEQTAIVPPNLAVPNPSAVFEFPAQICTALCSSNLRQSRRILFFCGETKKSRVKNSRRYVICRCWRSWTNHSTHDAFPEVVIRLQISGVEKARKIKPSVFWNPELSLGIKTKVTYFTPLSNSSTSNKRGQSSSDPATKSPTICRSTQTSFKYDFKQDNLKIVNTDKRIQSRSRNGPTLQYQNIPLYVIPDWTSPRYESQSQRTCTLIPRAAR
jgi:hypothetical protein